MQRVKLNAKNVYNIKCYNQYAIEQSVNARKPTKINMDNN